MYFVLKYNSVTQVCVTKIFTPHPRRFYGGEKMGRFKGETVVAKHQAALARCKDKESWALLSCIVDEMQKEYGRTPLR
jgi:hypothetical protein